MLGVLYLLRRDACRGEARSLALWIPVMWLGIAGSRFVSQWISLGSGGGNVDLYEGSTIDAVFFSTLIASGFWILSRRRVELGDVIRANGWIVALVLYGLISILWSDYPMTAGKRWIKTLGHPLMALIILSEPDPKAALRTVLKRCAFILLPLSLLFVKYLPEYGRSYDAYSGTPFQNGVGLTKNDLGYLCMVCGIFFVWNLLTLKRIPEQKARRVEAGLSLVFILTAAWLLNIADSATSLAAVVVGIAVMIGLGWRIVSKRFFGTFIVVLLVIGFVLESWFDLYERTLYVLGRDPTLTDRKVIWADVIALQNRPIFGFGFESFWLGERLDVLWAKWRWRPNQSHNGYLETYLNLGWIGVGLLVGALVSTFRKISRQLHTDFDFARLRMAFLFAIVLFNYAEAGFKGVHFMWTIFYIIAMELPRRNTVPAPMKGVRN